MGVQKTTTVVSEPVQTTTTVFSEDGTTTTTVSEPVQTTTTVLSEDSTTTTTVSEFVQTTTTVVSEDSTTTSTVSEPIQTTTTVVSEDGTTTTTLSEPVQTTTTVVSKDGTTTTTVSGPEESTTDGMDLPPTVPNQTKGTITESVLSTASDLMSPVTTTETYDSTTISNELCPCDPCGLRDHFVGGIKREIEITVPDDIRSASKNARNRVYVRPSQIVIGKPKASSNAGSNKKTQIKILPLNSGHGPQFWSTAGMSADDMMDLIDGYN